MSRFWAKFSFKGGFEVTTKHDMITGLITIIMILFVGALAVTNHLSGAIETASLSGLGMIFVYWFSRGSAIGAGQSPTALPSTDQIAQAAVQVALAQVGQTPAQPTGVAPGASNSQG
jgi:hypothetical protein